MRISLTASVGDAQAIEGTIQVGPDPCVFRLIEAQGDGALFVEVFLLGAPGALQVDLLGALGGIRQHRGAIPRDLQKPGVESQKLLSLALVAEAQLADAQLRHERRVAVQYRKSA